MMYIFCDLIRTIMFVNVMLMTYVPNFELGMGISCIISDDVCEEI